MARWFSKAGFVIRPMAERLMQCVLAFAGAHMELFEIYLSYMNLLVVFVQVV